MPSPGQRTVAGLALLLCVIQSGPVRGTTVAEDFFETTIASGLANPTAMAIAPDGRLFVCEQGGQLRVIKDGVLLSAPFLSVTVNSQGERGLLGVTLDPGFEINQYVYVYYTATTPSIHNRVSRFTASGDVAVAGSEAVILNLNPLSSATNHNGGALHFGPDGLLYIGVGDNASGANAQSLSNLLGKILRIGADGSIPSDNPFFVQATGANRAIWALGLRNPFTFAIEPLSGRMMINDVGQNAWEEINEGGAGANYGWPITEGPTTDSRFTGPLYAYTHASGACAISGGAFYPVPASQYPTDYAGDYFFADFCAGWIRRYDFASATVTEFASQIAAPVDLGVGPDGSLYYLARGDGNRAGVVVRIDFAGHRPPVITRHPSDAAAPVGQAVTFRVTAAGTPPLVYQWQRNGVDIPGATAAFYTLSADPADKGAQFRCRVFNEIGEAISHPATLTVIVGRYPVATIQAPAVSMRYAAGGVIAYSGWATDREDGVLPPSRFTWEVDFHHDGRVDALVAPRTGDRRGSFTIPRDGEPSTNVWVRIRLTVTDSDGQRSSTVRDVRPALVWLTIGSRPKGLTITLDGRAVITPYSFSSVVGMRRSIGAGSPQVLNGSGYVFQTWSDGGAATHTIQTPSRSMSVNAAFRQLRSAPPGARPAIPRLTASLHPIDVIR